MSPARERARARIASRATAVASGRLGSADSVGSTVGFSEGTEGSGDGSTGVSPGVSGSGVGASSEPRVGFGAGSCDEGLFVGVPVARGDAEGVGEPVGAPHQEPVSGGAVSSGVSAQPVVIDSVIAAHTNAVACFVRRENLCGS